MDILHLASYNRWTGAAAPAFEEVEALRQAGLDAGYAFAGGFSLEERVGDRPYTAPLLRRSQDPFSILLTVRRLRRFLLEHQVRIIHAHLSHDHWLAFAARRGLDHVRLVRTFHARRALRTDPFTRSLIGRTDAICVVNSTFLGAPELAHTRPLLTPPPVDRRTYAPDGPDARALYGIAPEIPLVGYIGKIAARRGFDEAIETFRVIRDRISSARMLIIGRGEYRRNLEALAARLGVADAIVWAGYHEEDLAEHYRAVDLMLFTAPGSDEGHRAVIEALACGTPVASFPIFGMDHVLGPLSGSLMTEHSSPEALGALAAEVLDDRDRSFRSEAVALASRFDYRSTAERLIGVYGRFRHD